jgi:hypothetical protein
MSDHDLRNLYENVRRGDEYHAPQRESELYKNVYMEKTGNNELKVLCKKLNDIGDRGYLSDNDLLYLNQFLDSRAYLPVIISYLNESNITDKTLSDKDAVDGITKILQSAGVTDKFVDYLGSQISFSILGKSGNLLDIISSKLSKFNITRDVIIRLMQFEGTEGGRGVGQCELGLATIFNDVTVRDGHGDLSWRGEYLEVKGSKARLGGRDVPLTGFEQTILGSFAIQHDLPFSTIKSGGNKYNIVDTIIGLSKVGVPPAQLKAGVIEFVKKCYPNSGKVTIPGSFKDKNKLRNYLETCYFTHYALTEGVEHFIFINTGTSLKGGSEIKTPTANFGKYIIFQTQDIPKLVNAGAIGASTITSANIYPSLGAPNVSQVPLEGAME